jgi:hypothetical protein
MAIHSIPALQAREDQHVNDTPNPDTDRQAPEPAAPTADHRHQDQAPEPGRIHAAAAAIATHRGWLAAVPIMLVNAVAFTGQLAFLRAHLPIGLAGQVLVAVALESVAVYLAYHAHVAQLADDSAMRLRLAAYGWAAGIAVMNYSHWAAHWRPTFAALAFAICSAASPWLWSVHSRRASRDTLKARGLIEPHAVRLGGTRWAWHPIKSTRVMSAATWTGENDPAAAIALAAAAELPPVELDTAVLAQLTVKERLLVAWGAIGSLDVPKALAVLKEQGTPVDQSQAYATRKAIEQTQAAAVSNGDRP